jgi:hypothetical protein
LANTVTSLLSFIVMLAVTFAVLGDVLPRARAPLDSNAAINRADAEASMGALAAVGAVATEDGGGATVDITILNEGNLSYANFEDWDINIRYTNAAGTLATRWFPYASAVQDDRWTTNGLYLDEGAATGESLEPGVLNPLEYAVLRVRIADGTLAGTRGWAVVTPPAGSPASVFFDA